MVQRIEMKKLFTRFSVQNIAFSTAIKTFKNIWSSRKLFLPLRRKIVFFMSKYINPFLDWSFKYLFGRDSVKDMF